MKSTMRLTAFLAIICLLPACANYKLHVKDQPSPPALPDLPDKEIAYQVYLIGDAGGSLPNHRTATLQLLSQELERAPENSAVVFLGGNALPLDLPGGCRQKTTHTGKGQRNA